MKTISKPALGFFSALLGGFAVFAAVQLTLWARDPSPTLRLNVQDTPVNRESHGATTSYAPIIKRASPSVVNIYSTRTVRVRRPQMPFPDNPMFREFFGENPDDGSAPDRPNRRNRPNSDGPPRQEQALGSGVIVSSDGYILTANHVVEGADPDGVEVALPASGKKFTAKIIGTDPPTDVALLKVDATDLIAITIADSDKLEVGDVCLAIGCPFGLSQTVTMGMVSALGRSPKIIPAGYENFIQTDAAINQGNSGGALIDAEGRLIGINTAIFSPSGANAGIGFAVPANLTRTVMDHLIRFGKFTRGYLGVDIQTLTPELAEEFKLPDQNGAIVTDVRPKSPAEEAGLQSGDVIRQLNGKPVIDSQQLRLSISQTAPGSKVTLGVLRSEPGRQPAEKTVTANLSTLRPEDLANRGNRSRMNPAPEAPADSEALDGVEVDDLDAKARQQYNVPPAIRGALVTNVEQDSTSFKAGLRPGDVILEINRRPVRTADDAVELSKKIQGDRTLLRIWRDGGSVYLPVRNAKAK